MELRSKPLSPAGVLEGKAVAERCRLSTGLSEDIVLGLSFVPDHTDVENLDLGLQSGEFSLSEFTGFCRLHELKPLPSDDLSAARFLAHVWGQPLAWLHLPDDGAGYAMAVKIFRWAESSGFLVTIGQGSSPISESSLAAFWPDA